ncbi:PAS domain S-box protein [Magnetococcus sp. PR-3]|uniref:PAS domain S-box protein n=1 Tax=Magnetococcus sp. PR-3 TaxID=3120355 RepID=UPI002FCE447B
MADRARRFSWFFLPPWPWIIILGVTLVLPLYLLFFLIPQQHHLHIKGVEKQAIVLADPLLSWLAKKQLTMGRDEQLNAVVFPYLINYMEKSGLRGLHLYDRQGRLRYSSHSEGGVLRNMPVTVKVGQPVTLLVLNNERIGQSAAPGYVESYLPYLSKGELVGTLQLDQAVNQSFWHTQHLLGDLESMSIGLSVLILLIFMGVVLKGENSPFSSKKTAFRQARGLAIEEKILQLPEVMVVVLDAQGCIEHINPKGCALIGSSLGALIGKPWFGQFATPVASTDTSPAQASVIIHNGAQTIEVTPVKGPIQHKVWQGSKLDADVGGGGVYTCVDVTEQVQFNQQLSESEARFRGVADAAMDAMILMDHHGAVLFWNQAAERIFGYKAEEVLGQNLHQALAPERYRQQFEKVFPHFCRTGQGGAVGKTLELPARHKEGHEFPIELSLSAVPHNNQWHGVGVVRDITQRKQLEAELLHDKDIQATLHGVISRGVERISLDDYLEEVLDILLDLSWLALEKKGCIFLVKEGESHLTMVVQQNLSEHLLTACKHVQMGQCLCGKAAQNRALLCRSHLDHDHTISYEGIEEHGHVCIPILHQSQLLGLINLYTQPGLIQETKVLDFLTSVANLVGNMIVRTRNSERERYAHFKAGIADMNVSMLHNVGNAIMAILEQSEQMQAHCHRLGKQAKQFAQLGQVSTKKRAQGMQDSEILHALIPVIEEMGQFVDEMANQQMKADSALIIQGGQRIAELIKKQQSASTMTLVSRFNLESLLRDAYLERAEGLKKQAIEVTFDITPTLTEVQMPRNQLMQTVLHLLDNAQEAILNLKTPHAGSIVLQAQPVSESFFTLTIIDNGCGITEEDRDKIFRFGSTSKVEGVGMGLHVAANFVQSIGGSIQVESPGLELGSRFTLRMPLQLPLG